MTSLPAKTLETAPDDMVGEFIGLSTALLGALAAERSAQSRLIETVARAEAEGERQRQRQILAR